MGDSREWVCLCPILAETMHPHILCYPALQPEFPDELSERQLDLAIDWGRYAELIHYDDRDETRSFDAAAEKILQNTR